MDSLEEETEEFVFAPDLTFPVMRGITRLITEGARRAGGRPGGRGSLFQENAAQALAGDLRTQIEELQGRLREAETQHLAITRKTATALAGRLPAGTFPPETPEHPDHPRILAVFNEAAVPLRARDVCEALDHELLAKNIEKTPAKLKRFVKLDVITEVGPGSFTRKQ
ncbi:hypothetical protein [Streptomyces sp. NPDC002540]